MRILGVEIILTKRLVLLALPTLLVLCMGVVTRNPPLFLLPYASLLSHLLVLHVPNEITEEKIASLHPPSRFIVNHSSISSPNF
jgi:hypothetical protein